jgi:glycoside/pentoside/hexuronide:cation symporter, GPH family
VGADTPRTTTGIFWVILALSLTKTVARFDKKPVGFTGIGIAIFGGVSLSLLFTTGFLDPRASFELAGNAIPIGVIAFGLGQALWWGGCGMLTPLAASMIADASEVAFHRTGTLKDGSYAASFSFFQKGAQSMGLAITGYHIRLSGIDSEAATQTAAAVRNISTMTFLAGPLLLLIVIYILKKYPIDRDFLARLRTK